MRFDIISVFPEFFDVLGLSLIGKAQERGILQIGSHDLRDWTTDPHRTVDDTPAGGGAGMVMRPDIWGKAIDSMLGMESEGEAREPDEFAVPAGAVLAIPTPSGVPLTQRTCEKIAADATQVVIACGRYEGIDARVAEHYAARGVQVIEYSLGDYVLNGGEVAAVALIEAVGRLLPGMVGNPESLVEESYGAAGLLEYPVFTRPVSWRGADIPDVLMSGNHGAAARWRKDRALEKTAVRRPDMIPNLASENLDKKDRAKLAEFGYLVPKGAAHPIRMTVVRATPERAGQLAALAGRTFPDAAPATLTRESIESFISDYLSADAFRAYLADDSYLIMVLEDPAGQIHGYTMAIVPENGGVAGVEEGAPVDALIDGATREGPLAELSKFYIDRDYRACGASRLLWDATLDAVRDACSGWVNPGIFLGTNVANRRARKAYRKLGFELAGERSFMVGDQDNRDVVFVRGLGVS